MICSVYANICQRQLTQAGVVRTEVEEPSIGEKLLLAGLETCDKVGEEGITLACRFLHLCAANITMQKV